MTSPFDAAVQDERALTSALETADFAPALMKYVPPALVTLMEMHGSEAWPQVRAILREKA